MACERCNQSDRVPVTRAKLAERDGKVAVVLDVPMEECPSCGDRWLAWDVAKRLDELLRTMLASDVEIATRHFAAPDTSAA
ncbi:MAG TPA: YgiT-type zinc finger protein [Acidimicrobiales bacterium]|jgi:YgiT-type zinc finger domain-containing protein